ncbi:LysR family transcriptional regulator [Streptomyces sp. NPDC093225]|uniref:LysR family transcriptional regulator n=1 Tax=Streptomyces sp. NPDC093225 TaxID=3366034 RepID=UPI003818C1ED
MNVDLRHLRALAAIGDEGTVTGAAAALHVSQPALSRTLEQLESRLGTVLVERTTRSLRLTAAGRRLYEHAHRILHQVEDALAEAAAGARPLRVGFAWAALGPYTVGLLKAWRRDHPATELRVHRLADPEAALRRGEVDAAFLRTRPEGDGLGWLDLYEEPRVAALAEDDPLVQSGRPRVTLAEVAARTVALCATAATTGEELWPGDRRPAATLEVANVDEWLTAIATGDAVGVTADATRHSHPQPGVVYRPLADAAPVTVRLVWPAEPAHPATGTFRDHARRTLAALHSEATG